MPFSSLSDPTDLARAYAALDAIWKETEDTVPEGRRESERRKIAYLIAAFAPMALDEEDLKRNVLLHYRQSTPA